MVLSNALAYMHTFAQMLWIKEEKNTTCMYDEEHTHIVYTDQLFHALFKAEKTLALKIIFPGGRQ